GKPIEAQQVQDMVDRIMAMEEGTRAYLLAPIIRDRKGEYRKEFLELRKQGFQRVKVDGQFYELDEPPTLDKKYRHDIDVVVDRIVVRDGLETRLADSLRTALDLADGIAILETATEEPERITFSENFACPESGFTIPEIEPRLFSFNAPFGACPSCDGLGHELFFDERLVVPDQTLKVYDGALAPWRKGKSPYFLQTIEAIAKHYEFDAQTRWKDLPAHVKQVFLYGSGDEEIPFRYDEGGRVYQVTRVFEGVIPNMERRYRETDSSWIREEFERYQNNRPCGDCGGFRLRPEALAVKIGPADQLLHVGQVVQMSIREAYAWCERVPEALSQQKNEIARAILKEIRERLGFLNNVGLEYLTLSRSSGTLSGGESQRIRLASQIGSGLTGVLYVLDEPSIGLHQRDNDRLLGTLKNLRDQGNTVIVVEHDEEAIREADYVFDIGPGAGVHGGEVVAKGTPPELAASGSVTGDYLSGKREIPVPLDRRKGKKGKKKVTVVKATGNNLQNVTVDFPLGKFVCVTGVSGGGKSTLTIETLFKTASM
ncbi:MAG: excinuclease ABC subunit A, partial [Pseudomonadota bacterium]